MRRITILILMILVGYQGFSQTIAESTRKKASAVFDVFNDFYVGVPDSVDNKFFNLGVSFSGLYDYRLGKSDYSLAFGVSIASHNFYSDAFVVEDSNNVSGLRPIGRMYPGTDYKKNKISYTYFDIPLELRLRTKSEIRASVGFKFGFLIDTHSKYKGDDYIYETNEELFVKFKDIPNIEHFRYGITGRFGWKFVNITAFYSLTSLFTEDKGPDMYPISVGLSLMPF